MSAAKPPKKPKPKCPPHQWKFPAITNDHIEHICKRCGTKTKRPKGKGGKVLAIILIALAVPFIPVAAHADVLPHPLVTTCDQQPCPDAQEFTVWDPDGRPIFSVGEYGGAAVYGDQISVYKPGDVYHPVIQLRYDGTILIGGQILTGRDVSFLHCLQKAGRTLRYCQARLAVTP
jgi:hypothetical protein